jgi:hypothetical protein
MPIFGYLKQSLRSWSRCGWVATGLRTQWIAILAALLLCAGPLRAEVDYLKDVKPVLKARCYACHGPLKQEGGLRLDTVAFMRKGSDSGNVIEANAPLLLNRVTAGEDERMPPEGARLAAAEIAAIKAWLANGAAAPSDEQPELDPSQHWAYQVPRRADAHIDSLRAARLQAKGLQPQASASPEVWLRRVYFDLIGLPPTAAEVRAFQQSFAAGPAAAKAGAVDRLLSSDAYGERWARHFMDIWRYSDWYGLGAELRNSQKHIWHWRDWIVESLNADKPYDQMIVEMLAADEASPADRQALRATGFLARNYYIFNRDTWLEEVVEHTNRAFLGVTMQCAKCHDHKYDPIEQTDYYRMRAIFEPHHLRLDPVPGESDFEKDGLPRAFDLHLDQATYLFVRGDDKQPDTSRAMEPGVPAALGGDFTVQPVSLPVEAYAPGVTAENRQTLDRAALQKVNKARLALTQAPPDAQPAALLQLAAAEADLVSLRASMAADVARFVDQHPSEALDQAAASAQRQAEARNAEMTLAAAQRTLAKRQADKSAKPAAIDQAKRAVEAAEADLKAAQEALKKTDGNYRNIEGSKVALVKWVAGDPAKAKAEAALGEIFPKTSTGRRLALARWIASRDNPLTARVMVNHVWTRLFGASLVPDVSDFGLRCHPPLHQDILDTLSVDFAQHGWSFKRLHRQLVLSELYGASSTSAGASSATTVADPDNAYYWRMNPRRLESQAIRDALLSIAGQLDLTPSGPSIEPTDKPVTGKPTLEKSTVEKPTYRRSIYFVQTTEIEDRFLGAFNNSNVLECYRRQESIAPQQALALANSRLGRECAEALAGRLAKLGERALIEEAFVTILGRAPTAAEAETCSASLAQLSSLQEKPDPQRVRMLFLQALLNHNDFVTLR